MSKASADPSEIYDVGFAEGYRGDKPNPRFSKRGNKMYLLGRHHGEIHFDKVTEIMDVTNKSLREVHQEAVDVLYDMIRDELFKSL